MGSSLRSDNRSCLAPRQVESIYDPSYTTSSPSSHSSRTCHECLAEQADERSFLRFDLETIHIEHEAGKNQECQCIGKEYAPAEQDPQEAQIHRIARQTIDAGTTCADEESGFMGLTVVWALLNEKIPNPATAVPISTAPIMQIRRAGKTNSRAGAAQAIHHMIPPARSTRASGGIFSSKRCMESISSLSCVPASFTAGRVLTHDTRAGEVLTMPAS